MFVVMGGVSCALATEDGDASSTVIAVSIAPDHPASTLAQIGHGAIQPATRIYDSTCSSRSSARKDGSCRYDSAVTPRAGATGILSVSLCKTIATNSGRGLSDFGGVIEQTGTNAAGGRVFTSTGGISQNDFAGIVNNGLMRGEEVTILSGAHGGANGSLVADASMFADDVAEFGMMPGVRVLDVTKMTAEEIRAALNGSGTIIGGFCNSGACLAPYGG